MTVTFTLATFRFMPRVLFFILFFFFSPFFALFASLHVADFVFITEPRVVNLGEISEEIIFQSQDSAGNSVSPDEIVDLEFLSTSATGNFLNASGGAVSTVMNSNWKNRTFYYRDSTVGIYTLTVKAIGRTSGKSWEANQKITISEIDSAAPSLPPSSPPSSGGANTSSSSEPLKIRAFAGGDRTVVAGSNAEFSGKAAGVKGELLDNARFWWNFGNGETREGRVVNYSFSIPGHYTVGLHVSSGEYADSDYIAVDIIPNQLAVADVVMGDKGYVKLRNNGPVEVDIGGWFLEDAMGKSFTVPWRTAIGSKSEIAFANSITGILHEGSLFFRVRYPNLSPALAWEGKVLVAAAAKPSTAAAAVVEVSSSPEFVSQKNEIMPDGGGNDPERKIVEIPKNDNKSAEIAAISESKTFSAFAFFALAAALGLMAAAGFLFIRSR